MCYRVLEQRKSLFAFSIWSELRLLTDQYIHPTSATHSFPSKGMYFAFRFALKAAIEFE